MKKILAVLLAALLLAALCACGGTETGSDSPADLVVSETVKDSAAAPADASGADTYVLVEGPAEEGDGLLDEEKYQLAKDCIGEDVSVLYDTIGEPEEEPHYASSCLEMNAEDGELDYGSYGFRVTTLKNDAGETVMGVVKNG